MESTLAEYTNRLEKATNKYNALNKKSNQISTLRLASTLAVIIALIFLANASMTYAFGGLLILFIVSFIVLVNYHNKIRFAKEQQFQLMKINRLEIARLNYDLSELPSGEEHMNEEHSFSSDLDLFGRHSLFQLLNRCSTIMGSSRLAFVLKSPFLKSSDIKERQQAVSELKNEVDWRQELQAYGSHEDPEKADLQAVQNWLGSKAEGAFRLSAPILYLLTILPTAVIALTIFLSWPFYVALIPIGINILMLRKVLPEMKELTETTDKSHKVLRGYSRMFKWVEDRSFESTLLKNVKEDLGIDDQKASKEIHELNKVLERFNMRANFFFMIFDQLFLLDFHTLRSVDTWKERNREKVDAWFRSLGEFEFLSSIAGFSFSNPDYVLPEIAENSCKIETSGLGHPLIPAEERVRNDFNMSNSGSIALITGSNMSGKSTFLRTVGINITLAYLGSPVCASSMELSVFSLYTSMRTRDNLEENVSSFFAELKRIRGLIEKVEHTKIPVFFMLDEILKGTNSADRHKGAEALIRQMLDKPVMGFVSTHDIELADMAKEEEKVKNYNFSSVLKKDGLHFDYTLREGVCESFNASVLMEKMGIKLHA